MSLIVNDPSTIFITTSPMIRLIVMFDPSSQPLFTGPIRPRPRPRPPGPRPGGAGSGPTWLRPIPCRPEEICNPRLLAEVIGRIVIEEDEAKDEKYREQARLVAVTIALALTDAEKSNLVASAIALLAIPPEKN